MSADRPAPDERAADDDGTLPDVDGVLALQAPIEPGSPSLENAAFVLLGVFVALGVVLRLFQLFG